MDPVAEQFLGQLDLVDGVEVPPGVMSGLLMCGDDALPGLAARALDPARIGEQRVRAVRVLARSTEPEAIDALVDVMLTGQPALMAFAAPALVAAGQPAAAVLVARAASDTSLPEARCVLAGLALRAGADAGSVEALAIALLPLAPRAAMQLMKMAPRAAYVAALRESPSAVRADPELAVEVLAASTPDADPDHVQIALALAHGLAGYVNGATGDPPS
jgi:hypothetical protein